MGLPLNAAASFAFSSRTLYQTDSGIENYFAASIRFPIAGWE